MAIITPTQENTNTYNLISKIYDSSFKEISAETWIGGIFNAIYVSGIVLKSYIDLGCGTGIGSRILRHLHPNTIIGVDISYEMLRLAKEQYSHVIQCDMLSLPLKSILYDCAICGFDGINHLRNSDLNQLLLELKRDHICKYFCFDFVSAISFDWLVGIRKAEIYAENSFTTAHRLPVGKACRYLTLHHFPLEPAQLINITNHLGIKIVSLTNFKLPAHNYIPGQYVALLKLHV